MSQAHRSARIGHPTVTRLMPRRRAAPAVRISGLRDGGLAAASFTSIRTGWAVVGTGTCAHFRTDCTQASAPYTTTDGGAHWTLRASGTAAA
jgi:hypothetical protein